MVFLLSILAYIQVLNIHFNDVYGSSIEIKKELLMHYIKFDFLKENKMTFLAITYRTLSGTKEVIETFERKATQWVVYKDEKPAYFVDFYDLEKESNAMMNSLVLCTKRSIREVLEIINKKNNINLSVPVISRLGYKKIVKSKKIELDLGPIPEEWLAYSL